MSGLIYGVVAALGGLVTAKAFQDGEWLWGGYLGGATLAWIVGLGVYGGIKAVAGELGDRC